MAAPVWRVFLNSCNFVTAIISTYYWDLHYYRNSTSDLRPNRCTTFSIRYPYILNPYYILMFRLTQKTCLSYLFEICRYVHCFFMQRKKTFSFWVDSDKVIYFLNPKLRTRELQYRSLQEEGNKSSLNNIMLLKFQFLNQSNKPQHANVSLNSTYLQNIRSRVCGWTTQIWNYR